MRHSVRLFEMIRNVKRRKTIMGTKHSFLVSLCILLLPFFAASGETVDLQIVCKPGIQIYIDGQFAGVTGEQDSGLLVHGINPGIHKLHGEDADFIPPEFGVSIKVGEITEIKIGKDGAPMILIPAGEFQMGRNSISNDEKPVHTVYVDAFYMDKYEVTNAQYRKFVKATGHREPEGYGYVNGKFQSEFKPLSDKNFNGDDQPVLCVSWGDAKAYAEWAGKRLPTEAEWEKAARGGLSGKKYPWGDEEPDVDGTYRANYRGEGDGYEYAAPVGSFAPNGYGLYDMAGNVWEWCADWYDESYYWNSPGSNPTGPGPGASRVLRGGSWPYALSLLRVANRHFLNPSLSNSSHGFRCASQD